MDRRKTRIRSDVREGDLVVSRRGWYVPGPIMSGDITGVCRDDKVCLVGICLIPDSGVSR